MSYSLKCRKNYKLIKSGCKCKEIKKKVKATKKKVKATKKKVKATKKKVKATKKKVKATKKKVKATKKKKTKVTKNKTITKSKTGTSNKYAEDWAMKPDEYVTGKPSESQLKTRRKRIDEVHKLHNKLEKMGYENLIPIEDWRDPPEYCYEDKLKNLIKLMKEEVKSFKKPIGIDV
jgi:hypothetical protein